MITNILNFFSLSYNAIHDYNYGYKDIDDNLVRYFKTEYGKEWSFEELNGFLLKPAKWIKGNKMGFAGLKSDKDRASVILYLNQNSDNPKTLP